MDGIYAVELWFTEPYHQTSTDIKLEEIEVRERNAQYATVVFSSCNAVQHNDGHESHVYHPVYSVQGVHTLIIAYFQLTTTKFKHWNVMSFSLFHRIRLHQSYVYGGFSKYII